MDTRRTAKKAIAYILIFGLLTGNPSGFILAFGSSAYAASEYSLGGERSSGDSGAISSGDAERGIGNWGDGRAEGSEGAGGGKGTSDLQEDEDFEALEVDLFYVNIEKMMGEMEEEAATCSCTGVEPYNQAFFTTGAGTVASPFEITTPEQLNHARVHLSSSFIVVDDITIPTGFNSLESTTYGWHPIGDNSTTPFAGNFDGNNKTITGLNSTKSTDNVGLFGYVYANARNITIKDIKLANVSISSTADYVGSIVGYASRVDPYSLTISGCQILSGAISGKALVGGATGRVYLGSISNCSNMAVVTGSGEYVGGIAGKHSGALSNCYNVGDVTSGSSSFNIGGIIGEHSGTASNCYNVGDVTGDIYVGGIAGSKHNTITHCYNAGTVWAKGSGGGGIVGVNTDTSGVVTNCYNIGEVKGLCGAGSGIGGIAGINRIVSTISNCYNAGTVTMTGGSGNVGGVVGYNYGAIADCYNVGEVIKAGGSAGAGSVVGYINSGTVSGCYRYKLAKINGAAVSNGDANYNNTTDVHCGIKTARQLWAQDTYEDSGWDFASGNVWVWDAEYTYPKLATIPNDVQGYPFNFYFDSDPDSGTYGGSVNVTVAPHVKVSGAQSADTGSTAVPGSGFTAIALVGEEGTVNISSLGARYLHLNGTFDSSKAVAGLFGDYIILAAQYYNITFEAMTNGAVTTTDSPAVAGATVNLVVTPDTGYQLIPGSLKYSTDGGATFVDISGVSFVMPDNDVTVYAEFEELAVVPAGYIGIWNWEDLANMKNDLTAKYILMQNLGHDGEAGSFGVGVGCTYTDPAKQKGNYGYGITAGGFNTTTGWIPVGTGSGAASFTGEFNGNNKTITGLYSTKATNYVGLFGHTSGSANIHNLKMAKVNINSIAERVGGVVGYVTGAGVSISNCQILSGSITSYQRVGGIVGVTNLGTIRNCYNAGNVTSDTSAGGIAGLANGGTITDSYNTGKVSSEHCAGGIAGYVQGNGTITNCYNLGNIFGGSNLGTTGGVVGYSDGTIESCYNAGNVSGSMGGLSIGGVVGRNFGTVANCYNTSDVKGDKGVGGIVGVNDSRLIKNCWNAGNVTGSIDVGGIAGENGTGTIENCYNAGEVSGDDNIGGIAGGNRIMSPNPDPIIANCYNAGKVSGTGNYVGAIVGLNDCAIVECYRYKYVKVNGVVLSADDPTDNNGGTKTASELWTKLTYESAGWNFASDAVWLWDAGYTYPKLAGIETMAPGLQEYSFNFYFDVDPGSSTVNDTVVTIVPHVKVTAPQYATDVFSTTPGSGFGALVLMTGMGSVTMPNGVNYLHLAGTFTKEDSTTKAVANAFGTYGTNGLQYNITFEAMTNGAVTTTDSPAVAGATVNLAVSPDTGYQLIPGSLKYSTDGGATFVDISGVSFIMPDNDVTVYAEFEEIAVVPAGYIGIWNWEDLANMKNDLTAKYILMQDLGHDGEAGSFGVGANCTYTDPAKRKGNYGYGIAAGGFNSTTGWIPVGTGSGAASFTGEFNGNNKTITGLYSTKATNYVGLFGHTSGNANIHDLKMAKVNINSIAERVGGVVGYVTGAGVSISNCRILSGSITSYQFAGGIVGISNLGTIRNCYNAGDVTSYYNAGGIAGLANGSTITDSYNAGKVSCEHCAGGVAGYVQSNGTITNCYNLGNIVGGNDDGTAGGVAGYSDGTIENCYNAGNVTGSMGGMLVGGVVGCNFGTVTNCYNTSDVEGDKIVGGIAGLNDSRIIKNCWNTGNVSGSIDVGGITGLNGIGTVENCYNAGEVSGNDNIGGIAGSNRIMPLYPDPIVANCFNAGDITGTGNYVGAIVGLNECAVAGCYRYKFVKVNGVVLSANDPTDNTGGTKTASEMWTTLTYESAGWDFASGTVWVWDAGYTYPKLAGIEDKAGNDPQRYPFNFYFDANPDSGSISFGSNVIVTPHIKVTNARKSDTNSTTPGVYTDLTGTSPYSVSMATAGERYLHLDGTFDGGPTVTGVFGKYDVLENGIITIVVTNSSTGKALKGATVKVTNNSNFSTYTTDNNGKVTITGALIGNYDIEASLSGYASKSTTAVLTAGNMVQNINIALSTSAGGGGGGGGGGNSKSNECEIISVNTPIIATLNRSERTITSSLSKGTASQDIDVVVSNGATWKLYSDAPCTNEITQMSDLVVGANKAYIKVTSEDKSKSAVYTITLTVRLDTGLNEDEEALFFELDSEKRIKYIYGYEDRELRYKNSITRSEVAMVFYRLCKNPDKEEIAPPVFVDTTDPVMWYTQPINYMAKYKVLKGYEDGGFRPTSTVTRAEFVSIISRIENRKMKALDYNPFSDVPDDHWAKEHIISAYANGWITGYEDGEFRPSSPITRAEVICIINNVFERVLDTESVSEEIRSMYVDLDPNYWAYADIIEAIRFE